jgi:exopolyphosphatase/guanosine-5'-triphosphate,3'-diphosphate pyrophosphatase
MAKRTAVIDIGSNSVRMIIMEKTSRFAFHLLHEVKSRVRISENAYQNGGELQQEPMERAISALRDFVRIAHSYDVRKTLCVATSAVRDANNKKSFLARVQKELGLNIKVISGEREAYLGGIACANLLPRQDAMTLDIGGGSTEYACIEKGTVIESNSLDLGAVRLKELYFDRNDIKGAKAYIDSALETLKIEPHGHIIGVGGTFRALAQIILKKKNHPLNKLHGFNFTAAEVIELGEKILSAKKRADLKELGIKKERYDVIRPGTLILLRIIKKVGCTELTCSGVGVREGVYLSDLLRHNRDVFPNNYNPSLRYLLDRHSHNTSQRNLRVILTKKLFALLQQKLQLGIEYEKPLLVAAKLAKIGSGHSFYAYSGHGHYLILTALEYGYSHKEIALIATLVRFQSGKRPDKSYLQEYAPLLPAEKTIRGLIYLLALGEALLAHHPQTIDFDLALEEEKLVVTPHKKRAYLTAESINAMNKSLLEVVFREA